MRENARVYALVNPDKRRSGFKKWYARNRHALNQRRREKYRAEREARLNHA